MQDVTLCQNITSRATTPISVDVTVAFDAAQ